MSTIKSFDFICGFCGNKFKAQVLISTNAFGSPDLDLRPPEMRRSTMNLWLKECPSCGYVNSDIESDGEPYKELLQSDSYKNCDGNDFLSSLSKKFYKYALISQNGGDYVSAYHAFLHAAWSADDWSDTKGAIICRLKALDMYDLINIPTDDNYFIQRADILRRADEFDRLILEYSDYNSPQSLLNKIVAFQIDRAKNKDNSVYRVADCDSVIMKLYDDPFEMMQSGKKTIEVRCNDEKRQKLRVGDKIIFIKHNCPSKRIYTKITELKAFDTFKDLYSDYPIELFGYSDKTVDEMVQKARSIYNSDKEEKYGVLAITVQTISPFV